MAETSAVDYLLAGLRGPGVRAHCVKHNDINVGIADVSACFNLDTVWIETKDTKAWPARSETRIWWDHYTEAQALFLRKRNGWLFVRVAHDYFWFNREQAWEIWEACGWPQRRMRSQAWQAFSGRMDFQVVKELLWG